MVVVHDSVYQKIPNKPSFHPERESSAKTVAFKGLQLAHGITVIYV